MQVDFTGIWKNQHGSALELHVADGIVRGRFESGVGDDGKIIWVDISGQVLDNVLTFHAVYPMYGTVVAWVGQHTADKGGGSIKTHWIHATNLPDDQEMEWMWYSNRIGSDIFTRA
jgi:hypothetical protein